MRGKFLKFTLIALASAATVFGGIRLLDKPHKAQASEENTAQGNHPAMAVEVTTIQPQNIQLWKSFSGHIVAVDQAEIRPQVNGRITEIRFKDGQHVEKGDVLIVIDPRPYEAKLNQAKALLEAAQTQAALAEKEYQRATKLIDLDAISQSMLDERTNNRRTAAAAVQGAKATVENAKIDLDYAYVKAPIAGKISRAEITEGNIVQAGTNAPVLTSVVSDEKVYVDFEVDERTYINSVKGNDDTEISRTPVRLELLNTDLEYRGAVHSFDNRIDPASGTIRARAIFENKDSLLLPGMTVTVLMGENDNNEKILVSERAIGTDQDRKFVYIVNGDHIADYREVKIGESINGQRVILNGLNPGEKVITEGLVRIRPGMAVTPKTTSAKKETVSPEKPPEKEAQKENSGNK